MDVFCGEGIAVNSFALVSYVPEPLAGFIERFRQEVQPACTARSHLTFLPPRSIEIPLDQIRVEIETALRSQSVFRVELRDVAVFEKSQVVHLSVGAGSEEARRMHTALHRGNLERREFFEYHPHVTLAKDLDPATVDSVRDLAKRLWSEYTGTR
ncbi:MAG TPA: 2'-5' RNA ligase family protein, partial [Bryobacteraceae bacterium]